MFADLGIGGGGNLGGCLRVVFLVGCSGSSALMCDSIACVISSNAFTFVSYCSLSVALRITFNAFCMSFSASLLIQIFSNGYG